MLLTDWEGEKLRATNRHFAGWLYIALLHSAQDGDPEWGCPGHGRSDKPPLLISPK